MMPVIAFNILPQEYDRFKAGFLKRFAVPKTPQGVPQMSEDDWLQERGRIFFQHAYEAGERQIAHDFVVPMQSIIAIGTGPP